MVKTNLSFVNFGARINFNILFFKEECGTLSKNLVVLEELQLELKINKWTRKCKGLSESDGLGSVRGASRAQGLISLGVDASLRTYPSAVVLQVQP